MKNNYKIAIVAGGTGGHLFPALSLLEQLVTEKKKIIFLSDIRVKKIIDKNKEFYEKKDVVFHSFKISKNFFNLPNLFSNLFKIFKIFKKNKPNIIVSFGGYTSIPFLIVSKILFKPIILHESNMIMGTANKLFYFFSKKVIFGWGDKKKYKINNKNFYIRNPVRKKILALRKKVDFNFKKKLINILIVGGSQGASLFDRIIPKSISLLPSDIKKKVYIYHQCSEPNLYSVKNTYEKNKVRSLCRPFFNNLPDIIFKSQFVISRSGSSTLSEITSLGRPAILIPYKFAKNNHQEKNAEWLVSKGGGKMILENEITEKRLKEEIIFFIKNKDNLKKMSKNSFSIGDDESLIKLSKIIS